MATRTWTGASASLSTWSDPTNWDTGVPVAGDDLVFAGVTRLSTLNDLAAATSFNSITFSGTAGAFTLSGNSISLVGGITNNSASTQLLVLAITLTTTHTINTASGNITINSVLSGTGGITKTGTLTLTLASNASTYVGSVIASAGILKAGASTNTPGAGTTGPFGDVANAITVQSGASLDCAGFNLEGYTTAITINGPGTSAVNGALMNSGASQQNAFRNIVLGSDSSVGNNTNRFDVGRAYPATTNTGAFKLTKIGSGAFGILNNTTGWTDIILNGGEVRLETNAAPGTALITANSGTILSTWGIRTISNNMNLTDCKIQISNQTATYTGLVTVAGTVTLEPTSGRTLTFSNIISGSGNISKINTGTVVLSGANTYSGTTSCSAGTLRISGSLSVGGGTVTASGGTLEGNGTISRAVTINSGATISPGTGGTTINTLTTGTTTLDAGSIYSVNMNSSAIPNSDRIAAGALSLAGTLSLNSLTSYRLGKVYQIASASSITGTFNGLPQGSLISISGRTFWLDYTATAVFLRDVRRSSNFFQFFG